MKIGFDAKRAFMNKTGLGSYSRILIAGFMERYKENEYYAYTPKIKIPFHQSLKASLHIIQPDGFFEQLFSSYWRSMGIGKLIKEGQLDIYHGLSAELPMNIQQFKGKKIVTIHDVIYERYPQTYPFIDRLIYRRKTAHACRNADIIITVSEHTKSDLIHYYGVDEKKIKVIYASVNPIFFEPLAEDKVDSIVQEQGIAKPYLICISSFHPRKNQLNSIRAFQQSKAFVDHSFILVGNGGSEMKTIQNYIDEHQLKNVVILKNIQNAQLPYLIAGAHLVVYPSIYEGFGMPIAESMAVGAPIIASNSSSLPEVGGDVVKYFDPNSITSIQSAMDAVLSNNQMMEQMKLKGKARAAELFSIDLFIEKTMSTYY